MYRNKSNSMSGKVVMTNLLGFFILSSFLVSSTIAAPMTNVDSSDQDTSGLRFKRSLVDIENPREVLRVLDTLAQAILESQAQGVMYGAAEKRGIDLGMNRGFSGRQAARHLVGLASAQFAGGPGRK